MSQLVPDWAIKSEVNKSLGQCVFKSLIGRWVSLYSYFNSDSKFKSSMGQWIPDQTNDSELNESVSQSVFKSSIGRYVCLYSFFNQSVLMS